MGGGTLQVLGGQAIRAVWQFDRTTREERSEGSMAKRQIKQYAHPVSRRRIARQVLWRQLAWELLRNHPSWTRLQVAQAIQRRPEGKRQDGAGNLSYSVGTILKALQRLKLPTQGKLQSRSTGNRHA